MYGNYWKEDVGHPSLYHNDSDDNKYVVAKYFANQGKGENKNGIITTSCKYTREERVARLKTLILAQLKNHPTKMKYIHGINCINKGNLRGI